MPEGPELYLASRFVNKVATEYLFSGCVKKSAVSTKNPDVDWNERLYSISAQSRGKEVKLTLTEWDDRNMKNKPLTKPKTTDILFRFGMSGKFALSKCGDLPKHAHLNFFTAKDNMVLSFVDYRRFGRWEVNGDWSKDRGPCVLQEYPQFREHVLKNIDSRVFAKPICEVMLNQKYFNGIGNYLRAEILHRLRIPPFRSAREVLENLTPENAGNNKVKSEDGDFLQLCNVLPLEVINLDGKGYDPESGTGDLSEFRQWLRCYYNPDMTNMVDHNSRTIWFSGDPGPLKPKESKKRGLKKNKKLAVKGEETDGTGESPSKKKKIGISKIKKEADVETKTGHITRGKLSKIEKSTPKRSRKTPVNNKKVSRQTKSTQLNSPVSLPGTPKVKTDVKLKTPKRSKRSKSKNASGATGTTTRRSTRIQTKV